MTGATAELSRSPDPVRTATAFCVFAAVLSFPWPMYSGVAALLAGLAEVAMIAHWRSQGSPRIPGGFAVLCLMVGASGWLGFLLGSGWGASRNVVLAATVVAAAWLATRSQVGGLSARAGDR